MYDFSKLNKEQKLTYDKFKISLCSKNSRLSQTKSEEDFRFCFENKLNSLLRDLGFISNDFEMFSHESKNEFGRTDFQYGNTIIEYKQYNRLSNPTELKKAQQQTQNYLEDSRFKGFKIFAFLFDGVKIFSYEKDELDNIIFNEDLSGDLDSKKIDKLILSIFSSGITAISPDNIKRDFGIIDKFDNLSKNDEVLSLLRYLFSILLNEENINPRTLLLYKEWEKMFRLAEGDNGKHQDVLDRREAFSKIFDTIIESNTEYKAFFTLHTVLSIIIKLFLTRAICDKVKVDDFYKTDSLKQLRDFFLNLENGYFFNKINILNLTDNDFFSWYVKENFNQELASNLQKIIFKICDYEDINIVKKTSMLDLFKELYQSFIPKCVRHSLGEYYTPYWLAERTFLSATDDTKELDKKTFIDPNCGSGTFLSVFFNYKHKDLQTRIDFADFTSGIVGVDINPIAVLMARANILFQGLQKCEFDRFKNYEIPVYLADSLYVPKIIILDGIECLDYKLNTSGLQKAFGVTEFQMTLPKELVLNENFLEIINEVEKHIIKFDEGKAFNTFIKQLSNKAKNSIEIKNIILKTIKELIRFETKQLNSIWLKIFSNYFKVATFDKFDFIIGNPAWVQWSVLPENYRENVKANIRLDGLFSNDKNVGGNNLNICALIANKSCERWLNNDGAFAFLMPKSILFNKSFEGFRNLIINQNEQLYLNEILDFSQGGEIFEGVGLDFCAFKLSRKANKNVDYVKLINHKKDTSIKELLLHNNSWEDSKKHFIVNDFFAIQIKTKYNNNYMIVDDTTRAKHLKSLIGEFEYNFRKGVNVKYPMRLKFVCLTEDNKAIFNPYEKVGKRLKPNEKEEIELELNFIRPFITAPMLENDWENDYCICPYFDKEKKPIKIDELKALAPLTARYLLDSEEVLDGGSDFNKRVQNFDEFYGILRMGIYVYSDIFVCIRDNTKLSPKIITKIKTHWGELKTPLFDNHISYISEVLNEKKKHERFIVTDEANYILEKLLDKDVQEIILNSQDSRSISSRLPIKLKIMS
ncbi:N-6 DNA methylase [Campylobacter sp. MG1]|uniref:N-6 DNA methylase n=1 Tax=Campylobacter sp. MG1 TaxID=2976332 RepID=UPI00226CD23A|nr:N-6 DNA methylase [Campylobacter sp. MG1]